MFGKDIRSKIAFVCIAIGLLYCSGMAISVGTSSIVKVVMIAFCGFGCYIISPEFEIKQEISLVSLIIGATAIGAVFSFINNGSKNVWLDPVMLVSMMIVADLLTDRVTFKTFRKYYGIAMAFFSGVSIVVSFLVEKGVRLPSYTFTTSAGVRYNTIFVCSWFSDYGRLMGPFWEPGLFASFVLFALLLELVIFDFEKDRSWIVGLLIAGIIASKSTAGYLLLALIIFIWFQKNKDVNVIWDIVVVSIVIAVFFFQDNITDFLYNINPDVFWKLKEESSTGNTRMLSPLVCFYVFLEKPLCGSGMSYAIDRYNIVKKTVAKNFAIDSLTTTNAFLIAAFGIWGIAYTIGWICGIMRNTRYSVMSNILLCFFFTIVLNKEPHYNMMLTYVMLFYMCKLSINKNNNNENKKIIKNDNRICIR